KGVFVDHHALEASVGTHVLADLLAHEACVAPCREPVEQHPEPLPEAKGSSEYADEQFADRSEIADEREPGPERNHDPEEVLCRLQAQLAETPGRFIKPDAGQAIAFDLALDPHENLGVDRLRTRISAEKPPGHGGEKKQGK